MLNSTFIFYFPKTGFHVQYYIWFVNLKKETLDL